MTFTSEESRAYGRYALEVRNLLCSKHGCSTDTANSLVATSGRALLNHFAMGHYASNMAAGLAPQTLDVLLEARADAQGANK